MPEGSLRVFIGSGEASVIERKVLIYTLRAHASQPLDIRVFNGTHNALERAGTVEPLPLPLALKYQSGDTEFGLYRYLVPPLCGHQGLALYLDSDILCRTDIADLFAMPLGGADFLARPREDSCAADPRWRTSVMLLDCARARFDLEAIFAGMSPERYHLGDFMQMSRSFLAHHPYRIGHLDPSWNEIDRAAAGSRLVHYTAMDTQPWKRRGHPYGGIWFAAFREAYAAGAVNDADIDLALRRGYVRSDLRRAFDWREELLSDGRRLYSAWCRRLNSQ